MLKQMLEGMAMEFAYAIIDAVLGGTVDEIPPDLAREPARFRRPTPSKARPTKMRSAAAKRVTVEDRARAQNAVSLAAVLEHVPAAPKARRIDKLVSLTGIKPIVLRELLRKPIEAGQVVESVVTGKKAYMKSAAAKVAA